MHPDSVSIINKCWYSILHNPLRIDAHGYTLESKFRSHNKADNIEQVAIWLLTSYAPANVNTSCILLINQHDGLLW